MNETVMSCENCRFFLNKRCHRYPPQLWCSTEQDNCSYSTAFPEVEKDDWCGEWRSNALSRYFVEKTYE